MGTFGYQRRATPTLGCDRKSGTTPHSGFWAGAGSPPGSSFQVHTTRDPGGFQCNLGGAAGKLAGGVKWLADYGTDIFTVTLNKSEKRFSPSTRYRDYPISPTLFHWESQSLTSTASTTGQRYIAHELRGSQVLLFVRENSVGDGVGASPFLFLGSATYLRHERERPIAIVWRLRHPMPPDFFQAARAAV